MSLVLAEDRNRVRTLTLNRADKLNACSEELLDALGDQLVAAATDDNVATVLLTGAGRAFCAGADLGEMAQRNADPESVPIGRHGFMGVCRAMADLPKPLIIAVNGMALGAGVSFLGYADLVFMSTTARIKCPFTDLAVAPELGSSLLVPSLIGRQNAAWLLMSSEWASAEEAKQMGIAWRTTTPEDLLPEATRHAEVLASKPISSLAAIKDTLWAPLRAELAEAQDREIEHFKRLLGGPANTEALTAFAEGRKADFSNLPPGW
ncbi:MAG: enoyl-CoA hydratase/isomerase [Frankiales bacterium]|nr:enoyl-CoA hydratase/isomerase [Frankiales bacterium]